MHFIITDNIIDTNRRDGNVTRYLYSASGQKLRAVYYTAMPYITRTFGVKPPELEQWQTQYADSTDYLLGGSLVMKNGRIDKCYFDGGYVELDANGTPTSWNYYVTDHLGSTRMVVDSNDSIKETINYYPFGSEMKMENPALLGDEYWQRFRFTGKELVKSNDLNMYDFGARWYDVAGVPMWTSIDPLAEKYYNVSPYAYCAGDPVNKFDPDGRIVYLRYKGENGKTVQYTFNPQNQQNIPDNSFVRDFVSAYNYNIENGGGDNMFNAAHDSKREYIVVDANICKVQETAYVPQYGERKIKWESRKGMRFDDDKRQSPATRLEHEFDHAVDDANNGSAHRYRRGEPAGRYGNEEEQRVIEGSESKTALANGEDIRKHHYGSIYDVENSTSTDERRY
jgi:RHS repeat-associated protein